MHESWVAGGRGGRKEMGMEERSEWLCKFKNRQTLLKEGAAGQGKDSKSLTNR